MLVKLTEMPDASRIWIYQAARKLEENELAFIEKVAETFLSQWQAHGQDLKSSFSLEYDQFLILAVDESFNQASGCSIDASVHLIQKLEEELHVSFTTNGQVAFFLNEKVVLKPFTTIKQSVQRNEIQADTTVFDNTIKYLADFRQKWPAESKDTWISRYF
ncbi:MAG: hypothetical protein AAGA66_09620 [Bacteroidota bacterium]